MLVRQLRVLGGVVEHQVHHHGQTIFGCRINEVLQQDVIGLIGIAAQHLVQAVVVLHRIERSRKTREVEGIHVDPVESHPGNTRQMALPFVDWPAQQGEQIVNAGATRPTADVMKYLRNGNKRSRPQFA